jgi:hypothetical protein
MPQVEGGIDRFCHGSAPPRSGTRPTQVEGGAAFCKEKTFERKYPLWLTL